MLVETLDERPPSVNQISFAIFAFLAPCCFAQSVAEGCVPIEFQPMAARDAAPVVPELGHRLVERMASDAQAVGEGAKGLRGRPGIGKALASSVRFVP